MKFPRCLVVLLLSATTGWAYAAGGGPAAQAAPASDKAYSTVTIPGPLRSFLRMAAISQKVSPEEVLPLTARNIVTKGYRGWQHDNDPTEYLVLLKRYVDQARELVALAGSSGTIRVTGCEDAKPVLAILGYQVTPGCGKDATLQTSDPERAFVTLDSGFPLAGLEEALRGGHPFEYPFPATPVPVLFTQEDWTANAKQRTSRKEDVLDVLLRDPVLSRVYWALSRMDTETRGVLRQSMGLKKLMPLAPVLDFYGSQISVREGRVAVPGGTQATAAWQELAAADPATPDKFILALLTRDNGWLAAYYDALARAAHGQQAYFTEPRRLRRFYQALRGKDASPSPARPAFRDDPGAFLLVFRLDVGEDGQPRIPGGVEAWNSVFRRKYDAPLAREWARSAGRWQQPDQVVEALFGVARAKSETGPLQIFLKLTEIDRNRAPELRLSAATVRLLGDSFARFGSQYTLFSEFHGLDGASMARFIAIAQAVDKISNPVSRANTIGTFQANVGLWQILARQGQIAPERLNESWQRTIEPFAKVRSSVQLYDAGRASLAELLRAATGRSSLGQDEIIALLAGPRQSSAEGQQMREELAQRLHSVMTAQRLVSLDTLFALGQGLQELAQGKDVSEQLLPLARELREFELPRPLFTSGERSEWAPTLSDNRHTSLQTRVDLTRVITPGASPKALEEARGQLSAFLRDTLVGLNYAYYEPPGAQMLHNNPLFVRSHDFSGQMTMNAEQSWQTPHLFGAGLTAGRGAHLVGSLADLPYVLAQVEQDFIVPENVQALIWEEMVPTLLTSATLPRWWDTSRTELHAVSLHQAAGEELLAGAAKDAQLRTEVLAILSNRTVPERFERIEKALAAGQADGLPQMMPGETFYLAAEYRRRFPGQIEARGPAGKELEELCRSHPAETSWERMSQEFGVPHPALAHSYSRELMNLKPLPALMGYGSRLLAESWDSGTLYWARLADEMGYPPVMLNRLVPELTRRMVEKIFATELEDVPALIRALHETADEFRRGKNENVTAAAPAAQP